MKALTAIILSLALFLTSIYFFQIAAPSIFSLLIYPAASSIICTLLALNIARSINVTYTSLILNNLFLILILIPLSEGNQFYLANLKFFFSPANNYKYAFYITVFALLSLLICYITIKCFICFYRSRNFFVSKRHMNRYLQESKYD